MSFYEKRTCRLDSPYHVTFIRSRIIPIWEIFIWKHWLHERKPCDIDALNPWCLTWWIKNFRSPVIALFGESNCDITNRKNLCCIIYCRMERWGYHPYLYPMWTQRSCCKVERSLVSHQKPNYAIKGMSRIWENELRIFLDVLCALPQGLDTWCDWKS